MRIPVVGFSRKLIVLLPPDHVENSALRDKGSRMLGAMTWRTARAPPVSKVRKRPWCFALRKLRTFVAQANQFVAAERAKVATFVTKTCLEMLNHPFRKPRIGVAFQVLKLA